MISIKRLRFRYGKQADELFGGLSHVFGEHEITLLTGPSGRGKSTLLYLLGLMLRPTSGSVLWNGEDMSQLQDWQRSRYRAAHVGFVFQDAMLDPSRTVRANVTEGAIYAGIKRSDARLRASRLLDEYGVSLQADQRPGEVSGGQAQRVGLARAMVKEPQVILADEPTGNLDRKAAAVVIRSLVAARDRGAVVVVATHSSDLFETADTRLDLS